MSAELFLFKQNVLKLFLFKLLVGVPKKMVFVCKFIVAKKAIKY